MTKDFQEYGADFDRMQHYFESSNITEKNLMTFSGFKQALEKVKWKMSDGGKKFFWKYQQTYLKQTGAIETILPQNEVKISITGQILMRLPRITTTGQIRHYWTTQQKAQSIGYRTKYKKVTREKLISVGKYGRYKNR